MTDSIFIVAVEVPTITLACNFVLHDTVITEIKGVCRTSNKSVNKTKSTNLLESEMAVGLTIALSNKLVPNEYVQLSVDVFK